MAKIIVIGGGPAGMMAAIEASKHNNVVLIEKNEKLGKKLYITGKGRCNVTNNKDISEFFDYIPTNPHFLYSALYTYTNEDVKAFMEGRGVKLKVERGDRIFPMSDKSSDIIRGFEGALRECGVKVKLNSAVKDFKASGSHITGVVLESGEVLSCDYVILATGGASYPRTGSTGDGYRLSKKLGHTIEKIKPSLVPMVSNDPWIGEVKSMNLRNVTFSITDQRNKVIFKEQGELLITPYGVSGPLSLKGSSVIKDGRYKGHINLKPALDEKMLDTRLQKDFVKYANKEFKDSLNDLLPQKLIPVIIKLSGIPENQKANSITREQRRALASVISNLELTIDGLRPVDEAIVTSGGVSTKEIDPSTMKSKIVDNLSFAGEVIDVDAFTGGYNVQIAFSTGFLAGNKIN